MSKKQATLFQSWGNKSQAAQEKPVQPEAPSTNVNADIIDLCGSFDDDDDDLLCEAVESIPDLSRNDTSNIHRPSTSSDTGHQNVCDISVGADGFTQTQMQSQSGNIPGFDKSAGKLWIYPTNYPVRDYQFNIVKQALYKNTMVTLPTGLGKTFIAAVVMYNYYRWYPQGKVIFMAPTKPLVAQQIEACYNIMGIPQEHTAEMTGSMGPSKREKAWHEKRVFFLTPQVLTNDLSRGSCPAVDVKCLVIDEAHKALGNHAYCQVVRELIKYTQTFRVLSLSATPGSDIKAVQQVLNNLLISQIEIRTEDSIDIKQYSHERKVEKVVVPLGDELSKVKEKFIHIMDAVVNKLKRNGALYNKETTSLSKFLILKAREAFRQNPPERLQRNQYGVVEGDFALAMSLYHGYELLQLHGSRSLYTFLDGILTGDKGYGRTRTELMRNADFNELMKLLAGKYRPSTSDTLSQAKAKPLVIGHPKMVKLRDIVLDHFNSYTHAGTRVMIFSQYRDSVQEITNMLDVHKPLIKVMSFIGQASSGKTTKGFTQKEQLKVMKEFREGGYNTLVSTCVGEEGLDIGDVDLIICFDAHKSPIRLVQRMGRTGRKREGRIVMLVTQGKEEQIYNQSQYSKKSIHKAILNGAKSLQFYQHCCRMVPENLNPTCHKMHITVKENFRPTKKLTSAKTTNQSKINSIMNDISSKKATESDEIITLEEYRELEPWLVPDSEIPKLPVSDICFLDKQQVQQQQQQQEADGKFFSLSEWSPWQTTLQDTHHIDHSMEAKHFVEIMEFVQLQQSLDPGDDPYGLEMAAYFNEEDVVTTDKHRRNSILNFCVTGQNQPVEPCTKKSKVLRSGRVHRSDQLPTFDFLDDDITEIKEDSDEDLPAFNVNAISTDVEKDKLSDKQEDIKHRDMVLVLSDVDEVDDDDKAERNLVLGKSVTTNVKRQIESKAKLLEKKMLVDKKRKRKKSRHNSGRASMVALIVDDDSNDFENNESVVGAFHDDNQMVDNQDIDKSVDQSVNELEAGSEDDANHADEVDGNISSLIHTDTVVPSGLIRIRTPPHEVDAVKLCQDLDKEMEIMGGCIIDLLALVDEWHQENEKGKYIVYPCNIPNIYTPNKSKLHERRKSSVPVENFEVDSHRRYSSGVKSSDDSLDESDHPSETVKADSVERSSVKSNNSSPIFKTPSAKNQNRRINKKVLSNNEMFGNENKNVSTTNLSNSSGNESTAMDVDSDDEIIATGTFALAADDIFSDDELDHSVFDVCDKFVEEVTVTDQVCDVGKAVSKGNGGVTSFVPVVDHDNDDNAYASDESVENNNENIKVPFSSSAKFDSFFADDLEDDLFVNMKTPVVVNKPHETSTQITFTQAINFVHSGSHTPGFESCNETSTLEDTRKSGSSVTDSEIDTVGVRRDGNTVIGNAKKAKQFSPDVVKLITHADEKNNSSLNDLNDTESSKKSDKIEQCNKTGKELLETETEVDISNENTNELIEVPSTKTDGKNVSNSNDKISTPRKQSTSSDEGLQLPEFDLDFDFDDDIIPPSPVHQVPSQTSASNRLSQAFSFSNRLSQSRCLVTEDSVLEDNVDSEGINSDKTEELMTKAEQNKISKTRKRLNLHKMSIENDECNHNIEEESQSILGDIPVESLGLNKNSRKSDSKTNKVALDTIDEKFESYADNEDGVDKGHGLRECDDKGITGKEESKLTDCTTVNDEFETSFALIGDDFDEWIDSGAQGQNQSCDEIADVRNKSDTIDSSALKVDSSHSKSGDKHESNIPSFSSKMSVTPVATISPFNGSQEFSLIKPSQFRRENHDNTTVKGADKNIRKSIFQIDDLSPDAFEDSFTFSSEMLGGKSTPKNSMKSQGVIPGTSTPLMGLSKQIQNVTPFRVGDCTLDNTRKTSCLTPSSAAKIDDVTDNDDSFIVRRKKKVHILESPISQRECGIEKTRGSDSTGNSRSLLSHSNASTENDDNIDDSALLHKNDYFSKKPKLLITSSSDEDFEQSKTSVKTKIVISKTADNRQSKPVKTAARKRSNPFLDEEAELSDEDDHDASSDEEEGSDQDVYEGSFIGDSQCTQAMDNTDIQAVYLKSVRSPPLGARGGYKLQFNHRTDIDVFSQVPEPENSEYMEDSFCVHSEEDDWLLGEEEEELDETKEVTMLQNSALYSGRKKRRKGVHAFQTSRQRAIQAGRMKALDEIKAKLAGKSKRNERRPLMKSSSSDENVDNKPAPKRSRLQILDESTSGEDCMKDIAASIATPDVPYGKRQSKKKARFLMSSDNEEDDNDFVVGRSMCASTSSRTNKVNEVKAIDNADETNNELTDADRLKMERLKRQKEKQNEYRRKMADKPSAGQNSNSTTLTMIKDRKTTSETGGLDADLRSDRHRLEADKRVGNISNVPVAKPAISKSDGKAVILIDSKEISGAQDIVSDLRFKYDIKVSAAQLPGCDFVISNRMAVERKQWSEFSNGSNRTKLIERLQHLGELYDRPCLVVEKDRIKPGEEKSMRPVHWTKYIDRTIALLLRSDVKVLYSDNMADTAELLADLCRLEERKNMGICAPVDLNDNQLNLMKFFTSIPKLSYVHALNLCDGFRSLSEFLKSSASVIEVKGKMSKNRALDVVFFVKRQFDSNMLPSHK